MPELLRVDTVHFGHEVTNKRLLIEGGVVGAQEIVPGAEEAVMVDL